jgi:endonuclease-8
MPEGDTIHRSARTLERVLSGKTVREVRSPLPAVANAHLSGLSVQAVEARGKNLLIHFDDGRSLYTHMRMAGSWHVYRPGEPWQLPQRRARVVLETDDFLAVCFSAPVVEVLSERQAARHGTLSRLGPDVLSSGFDPREALSRLREDPDRPIGEALLVQSVVAGIGNIYKSETLFLRRADPFAPVRAYSDEELLRTLERARELMSAGLEGSSRRTQPSVRGSSDWVYGRSGRSCRRCATRIRMRRQGLAGRSTYWCPHCQPPRQVP